MLTADKENNRDFDNNNLFLNLDFQHQQETFEYKWPLLDHPLNYQMIVTKFLTRTTLPYIKLHETKRTIQKPETAWIEPEEDIRYDYVVDLNAWYNKFRKNIFTYNYTDDKIKNKCKAIRKKADLTKIDSIVTDEERGVKFGEPFYWFDSGEHRDIYSLNTIYQMINHALCKIMNELNEYFVQYHKDKYFTKNIVQKTFKWAEPIFFTLEDNVPRLYILSDFLACLLTPGENIDTEEEQSIIMKLNFSKNLFKFFKGLPIKPCSDIYGEYCKLEVTIADLNCADEKIETIYRKKEDNPDEYEMITLNHKIFKGEKLNIMELSDYIGIAVTSPDFPVKEQIYPQFDYDFGENFFKENRRRYVPYAESLMVGSLGSEPNTYNFKKQNVTDLVKYSTGDKILFIKYFNPKTEDMNAICYENNNSSTTLKMDLMDVMPLKKFTLKLYLIDRYNNFEPLYPKIEGYDDVIKMQLLFTRIKGDEKENRNIIETKKIAPDRYLLDLFDIPDEEKEEEPRKEIIIVPEKQLNIDDILPDIGDVPIPQNNEPEKQLNIDDILPDIGDVPIPNEENEEDIEPPPEKMMYINNENEEDDDYDENGLY